MDTESFFKEVLKSHKDKIFRICCCYVSDRDARDDVFQETLIHIWKNLHTFEGRSQIGTWIYRITVNTCLRHLETERRRTAHLGDGPSGGLETLPDTPGSDAAEENEESVHRLYECINQLSTIDKALIALSLEDLSTREIAEVFDISEVNVRVKLHRIRGNLKSMLEKSMPERNGHGFR